MTTNPPVHRSTTHQAAAHPDIVTLPGTMITATAAKSLAVLRIAIGFMFLWAFLDKTFGWHYATPSAKAWIHGGSPTKGFLASVQVGPFRSISHTIAGTGWADWLFMLGLLGIGVALMAGVGVRIAAVSGVLLVACMWLTTYPLAQTDSTGAPTGSNNPFVDDHLLEALILVVLALTYAGTTWGLGRRWARLPFVARHGWAL